MMRRRSIIFLVLISLLAPAEVQAETPQERALRLYSEAKTLFEKGEFRSSVKRLNEAYKAWRDPNILVKKAQCFEKLLEPEAALEIYQLAQHEHGRGPRRLSPPMAAKVETTIKALKAELERPVRMSIMSNVPGARITIDDQIHFAPVVLELKRGEHSLQVSKPGWVPIPKTNFTVKGLGEQSLFLTLKPLSGNYIIQLPRGGALREVRIDQQVLPHDGWSEGRSPAAQARVGRHELVCIWESTSTWTEFEVLKDLTVTVTCSAPPAPAPPRLIRRPRWPSWLLAAGAGALTGAGFLALGYIEDRNLPNQCDVTVKTSKLGWAVGLGVAGLAATGVSLWQLLKPLPLDSDE